MHREGGSVSTGVAEMRASGETVWRVGKAQTQRWAVGHGVFMESPLQGDPPPTC